MSKQPKAATVPEVSSSSSGQDESDEEHFLSFYSNLDRIGGLRLMRVLSQQAEAAVAAADPLPQSGEYEVDDEDSSSHAEAAISDSIEEVDEDRFVDINATISDDEDIWYLFEDDGRPRKLSRRQKKHRRLAAARAGSLDAAVLGHVAYSDVGAAPPTQRATEQLLHTRQTRAGLWSPLSLMDLCLHQLCRPSKPRRSANSQSSTALMLQPHRQLPRPLLRRLQRERLFRNLRELSRQWWRERAADLNRLFLSNSSELTEARRSSRRSNLEDIFFVRSIYCSGHFNCNHQKAVDYTSAYDPSAHRSPALIRTWRSRGDTCRFAPVLCSTELMQTRQSYMTFMAFSSWPSVVLCCLAALEFDWRKRCIRSSGICHELANRYAQHVLPYCLWSRGLVDEACAAFLATSNQLLEGADRASMLNEVARMYSMLDMPNDAVSFHLMALRECLKACKLADQGADDRHSRLGAHFQQLAMCAAVFDEGCFEEAGTQCGQAARDRWRQVFTEIFVLEPEGSSSAEAQAAGELAPFINAAAVQAAIQLGSLSDGQVDAESHASAIEAAAIAAAPSLPANGDGSTSQQQQQHQVPAQHVAPLECGLRAIISMVFVHCGDSAEWCRETLVQLDRLHQFTNLTSIYQSLLRAVLGERRAAIDYARDALATLRSVAPHQQNNNGLALDNDEPVAEVSRLAVQLWQPLLDQISFHGRLPTPMRMIWRRSLTAPLLPTPLREPDEAQRFAWLVGDDCSESLNLRLDSDGYLTGDMQLLMPRVCRIRLDPLTGRLLLKGGGCETTSWFQPPAAAECSKVRQLETDEPRQLILQTPSGREFTYLYSAPSRLKHACRLDAIYSIGESGEIWRESPVKQIRRHMLEESLTKLRKRHPGVFAHSSQLAETFSDNPHLWEAAEKSLITLYQRNALLPVRELLSKVGEYHVALKRYKDHGASKGRRSVGGQRRPRLDAFVFTGQCEVTVLLDVSYVKSGLMLHYHHRCLSHQSNFEGWPDSLIANCHVYIRCANEDGTVNEPRLFLVTTPGKHLAMLTPANPTLASASWPGSLENFFGGNIRHSSSIAFLPRAGRRTFLKADLVLRHHQTEQCFVAACSSAGIRLFCSPYLAEDALIKRHIFDSTRRGVQETWDIGSYALFGYAIIGDALYSVQGQDLLRAPDMTRLVRCTWSMDSCDAEDNVVETENKLNDQTELPSDPVSDNLAYSRIILGIQWLTDCGRLLAVFLPDRLALLNPDTFEAVPVAEESRKFVELCGCNAVGDDLYGFQVPSVPNLHSLNWEVGQTLLAQSEIRCYRTLDEQPLANGNGYRTVLSVQGNVYVLETSGTLAIDDGAPVRVVCAVVVPGMAREARCLPNIGLLVCSAPLAQVFSNLDAESDSFNNEQSLGLEILHLFNWSGQLVSFLPGLGGGPHSFYCEPDLLPDRIYFRDGYGAVCCARMMMTEAGRVAGRAKALERS